MTAVTMTITDRQAHCIVAALDLYCRIGLGQIEELDNLARSGFIRPRDGTDPADVRDLLKPMCDAIKRVLGHPVGGSYGIGHRSVHEDSKRAFEIRTQIARALALHSNPNPGFKTVDYDGRIVAYTTDPDITIEVRE